MTKKTDKTTEWRNFGKKIEMDAINWELWRERIFNQIKKRGINPETHRLPTTAKELAQRFFGDLGREMAWPLTGEGLECIAWVWCNDKQNINSLIEENDALKSRIAELESKLKAMRKRKAKK